MRGLEIMSELTNLPNIGKVMVQRLAAADITTAEQLKELGGKEAFFRLRMIEGDTCLSSLCALEGAVKGVRWHTLSPEEKAELKKYHDTFK
jgi:DNA transformation protein